MGTIRIQLYLDPEDDQELYRALIRVPARKRARKVKAAAVMGFQMQASPQPPTRPVQAAAPAAPPAQTRVATPAGKPDPAPEPTMVAPAIDLSDRADLGGRVTEVKPSADAQAFVSRAMSRFRDTSWQGTA